MRCSGVETPPLRNYSTILWFWLDGGRWRFLSDQMAERRGHLLFPGTELSKEKRGMIRYGVGMDS